MRKITKIEYQKKNKERFNIYLDDEYGFSIDMNILIKYSLQKNMELSDDIIDEILNAEERIIVYNYGISVLSKTAKSEHELMLKMMDKGFDSQLIDNAINKLKEQKYLDDKRYCEMYINDKINISKHGVLKIKEALYYKGIDKEIIEEKIKNISSEEREKTALALGQKKVLGIEEEDVRKKGIKLYNYLLSRGFEYETVKKTVKKILETEFDD